MEGRRAQILGQVDTALEQHDGHALACEVEREHAADRAGAGDDHGLAGLHG